MAQSQQSGAVGRKYEFEESLGLHSETLFPKKKMGAGVGKMWHDLRCKDEIRWLKKSRRKKSVYSKRTLRQKHQSTRNMERKTGLSENEWKKTGSHEYCERSEKPTIPGHP